MNLGTIYCPPNDLKKLRKKIDKALENEEYLPRENSDFAVTNTYVNIPGEICGVSFSEAFVFEIDLMWLSLSLPDILIKRDSDTGWKFLNGVHVS